GDVRFFNREPPTPQATARQVGWYFNFLTAKEDERTRKEDFLLRQRLWRDKWDATSDLGFRISLSV
ncbi:MAG: hypothetical protein QNK86_00140, partial [Akkermansiaceae bacterium]